MTSHPVARAVRVTGAAAVLAALLIGLPVALAQLGGDPLPERVPGLDDFLRYLATPDDGTLFQRGLVLVGWLAWASFSVSVAVEAAGRLTRRHAPDIPGLRAQQRLAAALVGAILATGAAPGLIGTHAAALASPPGASEGASGTRLAAAVHAAAPSPAGPALHLVERGQALLDLQDLYGVPWQRIAEANYGVAQPDGQRLERGRERIYPGWRLWIPTADATTTVGTPGVARTVPPGTAVRDQVNAIRYQVAAGDWLWHIADRYLDAPERYREIAALNPRYAGRQGADGRLAYPDYIEPGWTLVLPEDARDRGARPHASGAPGTPEAAGPGVPRQPEDAGTGTAAHRSVPAPLPTTAGSAGTATTPSPARLPVATTPPPTPALPVATTPPPTPALPVATTPPPIATAPPVPGGAFDAPTGTPDRLAPVALASAGLLAALVFAAANHQRRRRHQNRPPGTLVTAASTRLERTLRTAQQPADAGRVDAALRGLAIGLAGRGGDLPDPAGVLIDDGAVQLLLDGPCPDPPPPWSAAGDRWTLPAGAPLPVRSSTLAPLPALATVGSQAGRHVMFDLERIGVLTLHGDAGHASRLLRYLAAELARNTWSDTVDVLLTGFNPRDADLIASLNPGRVSALPSVGEAMRRLRRRMASVHAALRYSGATGTLAGRVSGVAGDAWMPLVLLAASPTDGDLAELATLQRELAAAGRCAVAAVTTGSDRLPPAGWRVTVTSGGVLHVRLPFLHGCLSAAGLTSAELGDLSEELRHAREATPVRVPAAVEPETWAAGTDAAGAVLATEPEPEPEPDTEPEPVPDTEPGSDWPVATLPRRAGPPDDPDLDDDLRGWHADDPGRPRVSILGPVRVDSHGTTPETRVRLHRELVVYLAQRGARGAGATQLDAALWPGTKISDTDRQLVIARARQWLGTDPGGNPWLSEPGPDLTYRLAPGYLLDWHLFRRLRTRGELRGDDGAGDLRAALHLVRGAPLDGADRPAGPGARNPYPWLGDSRIHPDLLVAAVVDTAHQLAELHIATGDTDAVRWAVRQAWLADPERTYDQPWRDLMRAEHSDGRHDQVRALIAELMEARDAEALDDLAPDTYHLIRTWSHLPKTWSFESPTRAPGVQDHELGGGGEADWSP